MDILGFGFQQNIWLGTIWKIISSGREEGDEVISLTPVKI